MHSCRNHVLDFKYNVSACQRVRVVYVFYIHICASKKGNK